MLYPYVYISSTISLNITTLYLNREASHHLVKVLRIQPGQSIIVFNGTDTLYQCELVQSDAKAAQLAVIKRVPRSPRSVDLILGFCIQKISVLEEVVRHATELGVSRIVPIISQRSEWSCAPDSITHKWSRLQTLMIEACKQSRNPHIPTLLEPTPLKAFLSQTGIYTEAFKVIGSLEPEVPYLVDICAQFSTQVPKSMIALLGPPGDLTSEEYAAAYQSGFVGVNLAQTTLRSETAALAVLSVLTQYVR